MNGAVRIGVLPGLPMSRRELDDQLVRVNLDAQHVVLD